MTTTQDTHQRFAWIAQHGGPVVDWADANATYRHHVVGAGLVEWFGSDSDSPGKPSSLSKHVEEANGMRMLELRVFSHTSPGANPVHWSSTLKVGEGRYVRASGSVADFPTALAQVEAHAHESRQLGGLTWWRESEDRWVSWLGAFNLAATKITASGKDVRWHFEAGGDAPTLEEAALLAALGRRDMGAAAGGQGT